MMSYEELKDKLLAAYREAFPTDTRPDEALLNSGIRKMAKKAYLLRKFEGIGIKENQLMAIIDIEITGQP